MSVAMLDQVRAAEEKADAIRREAAEQGMEAALERIGMPLCRVLPFRRRLIAP